MGLATSVAGDIAGSTEGWMGCPVVPAKEPNRFPRAAAGAPDREGLPLCVHEPRSRGHSAAKAPRPQTKPRPPDPKHGPCCFRGCARQSTAWGASAWDSGSQLQQALLGRPCPTHLLSWFLRRLGAGLEDTGALSVAFPASSFLPPSPPPM